MNCRILNEKTGLVEFFASNSLREEYEAQTIKLPFIGTFTVRMCYVAMVVKCLDEHDNERCTEIQLANKTVSLLTSTPYDEVVAIWARFSFDSRQSTGVDLDSTIFAGVGDLTKNPLPKILKFEMLAGTSRR